MFKSVIVSAALGAVALGGVQYYATGAVPFLDAPTAAAPSLAAAAAPTAPQAPVQGAVEPVFLCTPQHAQEGPAQAVKAQEQAATLINLNTATETALDTLPDTGKARIGRITDARKRAPIRSVDSLAGPGMPASYLNAIRPYVTV